MSYSIFLDVVVVTVMLISGLLAMLRGLTREVLSIAAWAAATGAAAIAYFFYKQEIVDLVPIQSETVAVIGVSAFIFFVVLIIVSLLTIKIGDWVLDSSIGALDRTLGLLFGLARGIILVGILAWFFFKFTGEQSRPEFIEDAYSRDAIYWTKEKLDQVGQKFVSKIVKAIGKEDVDEDVE